MIKIFVISLKKSTDRRKFISKQLQYYGLDYEIFDGIDSKTAELKKYADRVDIGCFEKNIGRKVFTGEVGCALSHSLVYDKIVKQGIQGSIILEDDVILSDDFAELIKSGLLQQKKYKMVFLYHVNCRVIVSKLQQFFKSYKIAKITNQCAGAVAYYIDYDMAVYLQNTTKIIDYPSDFPIDTTRGGIYAITPRIAQHPKITNTTMDYDKQVATVAKKIQLFGRFGFFVWLKYKIIKPFTKNISANIEGD